MPEYDMKGKKIKSDLDEPENQSSGFTLIEKGIICAFVTCGIIFLLTPFIAIGMIPLPSTIEGGNPLLYATGLGILDLTILMIVTKTAKRIEEQMDGDKPLMLSAKLLIFALILSGACLCISVFISLNVLPMPMILGLDLLDTQFVYGAGLGLFACVVYGLLYHFCTWLWKAKNMD